MEAEMSYLLEEKTRKLENAEMLIEKLKEEVGHWEEDFAMFDRAHEKAIDLWRKEHPDAGYTPDMSDLNEWLVGRLEKAEAVKESLTSALRDIKKNVDDWNLQDYVTIRRLVNAALRTAEDSSVVGLIDSTPAKQFPNAVNADGYEDILFDIEASLRAKTEVMKRLLESQTLSPELAALGRELVRLAELAEKSLGEVGE